MHAVPGGPNVTLQRNGTNESGVTNLAYKSATQYYDVNTETSVFTLRSTTGNAELVSANVRAERGNKYTLVALPALSGVELMTIRDPYNYKSVASDDARLRVVNAAVNAQPFDVYVTAPATDLARQWQGWATALKPAWEPIILARKPLVGTVAANVERWGTGALNVDGCRVEYSSPADQASATPQGTAKFARHLPFYRSLRSYVVAQ